MKISEKKKEKIFEQIMSFLYHISPKAVFTIEIAREVARDEEFTKKLLIELKQKKFVIEIKKNPKGITYLKRSRWKLSDNIYNFYKSIKL
jgi:hypothetical protein